jgi:plastocyanin
VLLAVAAATLVTASGTSFAPQAVTVDRGDTVRWRNGGGVHNVVFKGGGYRSGKPTPTRGPLAKRTFRRPGTYRYYCEIHRSAAMRGRVVVKR